MNYIKRGEVIKMIHEKYPTISVHTIRLYIDMGIIKHSKFKVTGARKDKLFSVAYIKKLLGYGKATLDWDKVKKLSL